MTDPSPPLTDEGLPVIEVSPPTHRARPSLRLPRQLVVANVAVLILGLLGIPVSLAGMMGAGMGWATTARMTNAEVLLFLTVCLAWIGLPFVCGASIAGSLFYGRRGETATATATAIALVPPAVCAAIVVLSLLSGV